MSSDHLAVDLGDHLAGVGDELGFGVDYGALLRAMTSPFVTAVEHPGSGLEWPPAAGSVAPAVVRRPARA